VLIAAVGVFLFLFAVGALSSIQALIGFALVAGAALIGTNHREAAAASERIQRERGRQIDHQILEAVIAGLPDPVILVERNGIVVAFNAQARVIAPALARDEPISFALRNPDVLDAIRHAAANEHSQRVEFFERVPSDRWSEANIVPVVLPAALHRGPRDLLIVTLRDLTPLRRVEEMRADFVANASHELRTPLASLSGFIETLQGSARDDPQARERFLAIMKEQATRMARLIDDLLSLSRIELKAHIQPQSPVDLASIVREVADALQTLARDRGVEIKIDVADEPLVVPGDRDELMRVFENLVENALKYAAGGKRIDIVLRRESGSPSGNEAVAAVVDYGPGIAPEHLPRLTERFYRVDVAESRVQGGTGLGLALVKHVLSRHRGRLTIESEIGKGARFMVRLPLLARDAAS
jgi:two-component system phosphate regulon sensor histidine kinase PhoR